MILSFFFESQRIIIIFLCSEAEVCLGVPFKAIIRVLVLDAIEIFRLLPGTGLQL